MRHKIAAIIGIGAMLAAGGACAMTGQLTAKVECSVVGGTKLPAATGGPAGICAAIEKAVVDRSLQARVKVQVQVKSHARLSALIERDGVALPTQELSISDSQLRKSSIDDFARAIAQAVEQAG